jgi:hypothetical protein
MLSITKLGGIALGLWSAFKIGKAVLTNWASEWEQFSPEVISAKAIQAVANLSTQMKAAERTGDEMAVSADIAGEQQQIWTDIKSILTDAFMPFMNGLAKIGTGVLQLIKAVVSIAAIAIKIISEVVGGILFAIGTFLEWVFGSLAEWVEGLYDIISDWWDWTWKKDQEKENFDTMEPVFDMFGITSSQFSDISDRVMRERQRQGGLPGNIRR